MEQRSPEWFTARLGHVTASKVSHIMAKTKSGYSSCRQNYMAQLICEKLTGKPIESFTNAAIQRGTELEAIARDVYRLAQFEAVVEEVGFIHHPTIKCLGCSPDGIVNDDGLIEIKCPNTWTHLEFLKSGKPKREYILQMQTQMMCTGREWCDFVSYDDRLPDNLSYKCIRIYHNVELAKEIETEVTQFLSELEKEIEVIKSQGD